MAYHHCATEAGIPVSITTDHPVVGIEHLMTSAILAVKNGFPEEKALEAITLNAAKHLVLKTVLDPLKQAKTQTLSFGMVTRLI